MVMEVPGMLETYPIGRLTLPPTLDLGAVMIAIDRIEALPVALRAALDGCADLDHPIRDAAWSIRQLTHHLADSHLHAFVRTKLALTEDGPTVVGYDEVAWAHGADARLPPEPSLRLLEGLHARWVELLRSLGPAELERPWHVHGRPVTYPLWRLPLTYGWHGDHHVAQLLRAREHYGV
jgi:hypothetical protein